MATQQRKKTSSGKKPASKSSTKATAAQNQKLTLVIVAVIVIVLLVALFVILYKTGAIDFSALFAQNNTTNTDKPADPTDQTDPQKPAGSGVRAAYSGTIDDDPVYVHFIYVGQGDAIILEFPDEKYMLIDAGSTKKPPASSKSAKNIYLEYLADVVKTGVVDYMIVTHADQDHVSFMSDVLANYSVGNIFYNYLDENTKGQPSNLYKTFIENARAEEGATLYEIDDENDHTYNFTVGDCSFTVFSPGNDGFTNTDARIKNGMSLITLMTYGTRKMLFTGDATSEEEEWFIEYTSEYDNMDVDFLKIAHHGSKTSNTSEFLTYVSAEYGVICVGEGNSYGLPEESALGRIETANVTYYRTDEVGTIVLAIDGDGDFAFTFPDQTEEAQEE